MARTRKKPLPPPKDPEPEANTDTSTDDDETIQPKKVYPPGTQPKDMNNNTSNSSSDDTSDGSDHEEDSNNTSSENEDDPPVSKTVSKPKAAKQQRTTKKDPLRGVTKSVKSNSGRVEKSVKVPKVVRPSIENVAKMYKGRKMHEHYSTMSKKYAARYCQRIKGVIRESMVMATQDSDILKILCGLGNDDPTITHTRSGVWHLIRKKRRTVLDKMDVSDLPEYEGEGEESDFNKLLVTSSKYIQEIEDLKEKLREKDEIIKNLTTNPDDQASGSGIAPQKNTGEDREPGVEKPPSPVGSEIEPPDNIQPVQEAEGGGRSPPHMSFSPDTDEDRVDEPPFRRTAVENFMRKDFENYINNKSVDDDTSPNTNSQFVPPVTITRKAESSTVIYPERKKRKTGQSSTEDDPSQVDVVHQAMDEHASPEPGVLPGYPEVDYFPCSKAMVMDEGDWFDNDGSSSPLHYQAAETNDLDDSLTSSPFHGFDSSEIPASPMSPEAILSMEEAREIGSKVMDEVVDDFLSLLTDDENKVTEPSLSQETGAVQHDLELVERENSFGNFPNSEDEFMYDLPSVKPVLATSNSPTKEEKESGKKTAAANKITKSKTKEPSSNSSSSSSNNKNTASTKPAATEPKRPKNPPKPAASPSTSKEGAGSQSKAVLAKVLSNRAEKKKTDQKHDTSSYKIPKKNKETAKKLIPIDMFGPSTSTSQAVPKVDTSNKSKKKVVLSVQESSGSFSWLRVLKDANKSKKKEKKTNSGEASSKTQKEETSTSSSQKKDCGVDCSLESNGSQSLLAAFAEESQ